MRNDPSNHLPKEGSAPGIVHAWTDGACRGNPGPGGWGVLLRYGKHERTLHGGAPSTTNNRMELMAAISALEALSRPCVVHLTTDSQYVRQGMTEWLAGWKRRNWRLAGGGAVKNAELWQRLEAAADRHDVHWHWIKGHSGHPENEKADQLANLGIDELSRSTVG